MNEFDGRHVVVTGGTGALGAAVVEALIALGATCHIPSFTDPSEEQFPLLANSGVSVVPSLDLTDEDTVINYYDSLPSIWASIHVAGGFAAGALAETSASDMERMWRMNALTVFLCSREAVRRMKSQEGDGGRLVNVAAKPALHPCGGMLAYVSSKAAVASLTQCLAEELASDGIWVNAVVPSIMDTPANRAGMPQADHSQWPSVADVATTIVFLASPANRTTRGALVPVYGRT